LFQGKLTFFKEN